MRTIGVIMDRIIPITDFMMTDTHHMIRTITTPMTDMTRITTMIIHTVEVQTIIMMTDTHRMIRTITTPMTDMTRIITMIIRMVMIRIIIVTGIQPVTPTQIHAHIHLAVVAGVLQQPRRP
jgi:hypothetical protein